MKKALIAMSLVLAFAGVSFAADAAAPTDEKPAAEAVAPAKKAHKKVAKKAPKKAPKKAAAEEKKAE
jgi:hypothetical protein